jgi:hypothetical protein
MMEFDVKCSKEILIADKPYKNVQKTPSFIEPISQPVYFFCCFKTGSMTLLANVETTNVFMNDKLQIGYAVRNNSTSRLKAIKISVRKIQNFHAGKHNCGQSSIIYETRFEDNKGLHTDANIEPLSNGVRIIEANIPNNCPSYNGHLGNVRYVIEVRVWYVSYIFICMCVYIYIYIFIFKYVHKYFYICIYKSLNTALLRVL